MKQIKDVTNMSISEAEELRNMYDNNGRNVEFKTIAGRVWLVEYPKLNSDPLETHKQPSTYNL